MPKLAFALELGPEFAAGRSAAPSAEQHATAVEQRSLQGGVGAEVRLHDDIRCRVRIVAEKSQASCGARRPFPSNYLSSCGSANLMLKHRHANEDLSFTTVLHSSLCTLLSRARRCRHQMSMACCLRAGP